MKLEYNKEELQLISDGLEDTLIRLKSGQIKDELWSFTFLTTYYYQNQLLNNNLYILPMLPTIYETIKHNLWGSRA